jgi:sugar lactone lactonase YvrE
VYLSSLHKAKVVAVDKEGAVTDVIATGQGGFMWGLGMKFSADGNTLWACSANGKGKTALYAISHGSGTILKRYTADSARFLNDLVLLSDGRIFLTDTEQGALFVLIADSLQLFLKSEQLKWANGITASPDGTTLFVASGRYGVQKVDVATGAIRPTTDNKRTDYAIDGLVLHNRTLYAAIGWPQDSVGQHRIIRYHFDEAFRYRSADTLSIAQPWLQCPTTLALHKDRLFVLSTISLGLYNRHGQKTEGVMDSLRNPVIAVFDLTRQ